jgi:hypothetical protein
MSKLSKQRDAEASLPKAEGTSGSDKLAIALAYMAAAMAIALFLIEKTPGTVIMLLVVMFGFCIYPIWHFVKSGRVRVGLLAATVILMALFGGHVLSPSHVTQSNAQQADIPKKDVAATSSMTTAPSVTPPRTPVDCIAQGNLLIKQYQAKKRTVAISSWVNEQFREKGLPCVVGDLEPLIVKPKERENLDATSA